MKTGHANLAKVALDQQPCLKHFKNGYSCTNAKCKRSHQRALLNRWIKIPENKNYYDNFAPKTKSKGDLKGGGRSGGKGKGHKGKIGGAGN